MDTQAFVAGTLTLTEKQGMMREIFENNLNGSELFNSNIQKVIELKSFFLSYFNLTLLQKY